MAHRGLICGYLLTHGPCGLSYGGELVGWPADFMVRGGGGSSSRIETLVPIATVKIQEFKPFGIICLNRNGLEITHKFIVPLFFENILVIGIKS